MRIKIKVLLLAMVLLTVQLFGGVNFVTKAIAEDEKKHVEAEHPRAFIKKKDVDAFREKLTTEPFSLMFKKLKEDAINFENDYASQNKYDAYGQAELALYQSYLYLCTGDNSYSKKAYDYLKPMFDDKEFFANPFSKGLTRAYQLKCLAIVYDLCYTGWNPAQRDKVNDQLFNIMYSVQATMGRESNNSMESNWMGVRYGSVMLGSLVWDDLKADKPSNSNALPFEWEATKRLAEHLDKNLYSNGWDGESMGYYLYEWSFVGPALIALQNKNNNAEWTKLQNYSPKAVNSLFAVLSGVVSIDGVGGHKGLKADLSDDNPAYGNQGVMGMAFKLYDDTQKPAIKWMYDYLTGLQGDKCFDEDILYSLLFYPADLQAVNPKEIKGLNYTDPDQGITVFRNCFQDEKDIVATYTATSKRIKGHQGPDTNTIRIIGLGAPWVIGAGRTGMVDGQSNFFPSIKETKGDTSKLGKLMEFGFEEDGSGFALGSGSSLGTKDHLRYFHADYSGKSGAPGLFVVADKSSNGRRWRINTPECNTITKNEDGFTITAPNGASMKATVLGVEMPLTLNEGTFRYGGNTTDHNAGYAYGGTYLRNNKWIEVECIDSIVVVMTLQPAGMEHPVVSAQAVWEKPISVGEQTIDISDKFLIKGEN